MQSWAFCPLELHRWWEWSRPAKSCLDLPAPVIAAAVDRGGQVPSGL